MTEIQQTILLSDVAFILGGIVSLVSTAYFHYYYKAKIKKEDGEYSAIQMANHLTLKKQIRNFVMLCGKLLN